MRYVGGSSCWATSSGSRHGSSSCSNSFCVAPLYMQVWESGALRGGQSLHPWRSSYRRGSVVIIIIIIIIGVGWSLALSFFLVGYGFFFYYNGDDSFDSSSPIRNAVSCFRSFSIHSLHPLWHHIFNDGLHTIWISFLQKFLPIHVDLGHFFFCSDLMHQQHRIAYFLYKSITL